MSEVMWPRLAKSCRLRDPVEGVEEAIGMDRGPILLGEDEIASDVDIGVGEPLLTCIFRCARNAATV